MIKPEKSFMDPNKDAYEPYEVTLKVPQTLHQQLKKELLENMMEDTMVYLRFAGEERTPTIRFVFNDGTEHFDTSLVDILNDVANNDEEVDIAAVADLFERYAANLRDLLA